MAGGVITIELPPGADAAQCAQHLQRGIGLHRQAGLGRVWVNPPLLMHPQPQFAAPAQRPAEAAPGAAPEHALVDWLNNRMPSPKTDIEDWVNAIVARYFDAIEAARNALGYPDFATDFYPSRAQWGSVYEAARTRNGADLYRALFQGDGAIIKKQGKGWGLEFPPSKGKWNSLADWLKNEIAGAQQTCDARQVRQLARRLMDHPAKRKA
jgi:hypothetical protein